MKRLFDFSVSVLGLLLLFPFLLIISLWIALDSRGGVFFRQVRVGLKGQTFRIFKFRTMYQNADNKGLLTLGHDDPRITKIGYFLRKYKLDEFPQLINIFIGDMSFVGSRPEVERYVAHYSKSDREILYVKPGLTDFASLVYINEVELLKSAQNPEQF